MIPSVLRRVNTEGIILIRSGCLIIRVLLKTFSKKTCSLCREQKMSTQKTKKTAVQAFISVLHPSCCVDYQCLHGNHKFSPPPFAAGIESEQIKIGSRKTEAKISGNVRADRCRCLNSSTMLQPCEGTGRGIKTCTHTHTRHTHTPTHTYHTHTHKPHTHTHTHTHTHHKDYVNLGP